MSMELMVKAMKVRVGNPLRKLVLLKLADNASDRGECWPSYQHIADQCEISKRSVMNHIDALCECGLVKKELRPGPKGNSSNVYRLDFSSAGDSLGGSANSSLPGAGDSPHSAGDSLGGSAGAAPRISHSFEPVNESVIEPKYNGSSDNDSENRSSKGNYSNEFEQAWQAYPKRSGGNNKLSAFKAWNARIKQGVKPETMLEGVKRYAAFMASEGKIGTSFVKQAATFFGPDKHFDEPWLVETQENKVPTRQDQSRYEWYAKSDDGSAEVFINQSAIDRMNRGGYRP
ncbi:MULTISPECIES: helix-turn-helix domain-containing protein [Enterobacter cloacae complex]|uniref:helix-turn-helix domain-containing protein n=1 Tax=Enterobacter cloacae complex TaxID=354276 RepID=UPI0007F8902A|nr:helix-turn-helix domain-containing protein [Enterobacter hormaechei]HCM9145387.1 helix-turn-helix domain-containing protein [Enterobacter roggenkampii]MBF1937230.1 helix-turn-helix domain-containing protein [Enterobacter hormaechei]MBF9206279.1 helix-turn-helix domain-containing protein [Enterobacter hormaechei]MCK7278557.1 helix-turn-helix domain-containing protein [Enterobacter hormaechei]MDR9872686.1 helix-turn-helix domain-containing protein [Enterobacter hormaechei subsp. xiangfangensi